MIFKSVSIKFKINSIWLLLGVSFFNSNQSPGYSVSNYNRPLPDAKAVWDLWLFNLFLHHSGKQPYFSPFNS